MSYSSDSFTIFTIVSLSLFLIHSSGTLRSVIASESSELTKGDIWSVLFDFSLIIYKHKWIIFEFSMASSL